MKGCEDPRVGWCINIEACPNCSARLKANQERMEREEKERFARYETRVCAALAPLLDGVPIHDVRVSFDLHKLTSVAIELADGRKVAFSVAGDMYDYHLSVGEEEGDE